MDILNGLEIHQSALNQFLQCGRKFYFQSVLKLPEVQGEGLFVGSSVHYAMNKYYVNKHPVSEVQDLYEIEINTGTAFNADPRHHPRSTVGFETPKWLLAQVGRELIELFFKKFGDRYEVMGSEVPIRRQLRGNIYMAGTVDLIVFDKVDKQSKVLDFKVLGRRKSDNETNNNIQPTVYAYLTGGPLNFEYVTLLKSNPPTVERRAASKTQADIDWLIEGVINPFIKCVENDIWVANPTSYLCSPKFCSYYRMCKEGMSEERYLEGFL
jgi:hypothetical protein